MASKVLEIQVWCCWYIGVLEPLSRHACCTGGKPDETMSRMMRLISLEHCFQHVTSMEKFQWQKSQTPWRFHQGLAGSSPKWTLADARFLIRSPFVEPSSSSMHSYTERRRFPWHVHVMAGSAGFKESCTQKSAGRSPWWSVHVVISCVGPPFVSTRFHAFLFQHNWRLFIALILQGQIHMAVVCQKGQKSAADPTPNQAGSFLVWYYTVPWCAMKRLLWGQLLCTSRVLLRTREMSNLCYDPPANFAKGEAFRLLDSDPLGWVSHAFEGTGMFVETTGLKQGK